MKRHSRQMVGIYGICLRTAGGVSDCVWQGAADGDLERYQQMLLYIREN